MAAQSSEPSGDTYHRLADRLLFGNSSAFPLVKTQKGHEKAWYSKYLFRFGNGLRAGSRVGKEPSATCSAPVITSASRISTLSDVNTSKAGSLFINQARRRPQGS